MRTIATKSPCWRKSRGETATELSKHLNMQVDESGKLTADDPFKVMWRWTSSMTQGLKSALSVWILPSWNRAMKRNGAFHDHDPGHGAVT